MKKCLIRCIAFLLVLFTMFSAVSGTVSALTWSGDSNGIGGNAKGVSESGYAIKYDDGNNLAGYRFSVVDKNEKTRNGKVIDVFRDETYAKYCYNLTYSNYGHKFTPKYNKVQWKENQNKGFSTGQTKKNTYLEGKNIIFFKDLPLTTGIKSWMNNSMNLNAILSKLGMNSVHDLKGGDKVLVEPLFFLRINKKWHTMTITEIGVFGKAVFGGSSSGGSNFNEGHWGFVKKYTNRIFPNSLYEPTGADGLWTAATKYTSGYMTFNRLIHYGYGVGIAFAVDEAQTYIIKYDGNGATEGSTPSSTHEFGVAKRLTANGFKRDLYVFKGWNTKRNGSGTSYTNKQKVKDLASEPGQTVTLYAQWEIDPIIGIEAIEPNSDYREGVTVISSFQVINKSEEDEFTPDENVTVKFKVTEDGRQIYSETKTGIALPAGEDNLVYFKWTVPSGLDGASVKASAEVSVGDLSMDKTSMNVDTEETPNYQTPDTQYVRSKPDDWRTPTVPSQDYESASWKEWVYEGGRFKEKSYQLSTSSSLTLTPDSGSPSSGATTIKSGYGFGLKWVPVVESTGSTNATAAMYTQAQTAYARFPEFQYAFASARCRHLEKVSNYFTFYKNAPAENDRLHFTPLWYPNGDYTVCVYGYDIWTPVGMLTINDTSGHLTISGSLYDDYVIGRK